RIRFRCWAIRSLAAARRAGPLPSDESQQLFLLRADRDARFACARGNRRTCFGDGANCREPRRVSKEYVRSDHDVLALHGSFVALSASRFAHQAVSVWEGL